VIWTITWIVLGLLIVCVVAAVLLARPYVTGAKAAPLPAFLAGERMLVAFLGRGGDDLYLLRVDDAKNDGLVLAQDVAEASVSVYAAPAGQPVEAVGGSYGGFVPGKDWLFVWYAAGDVSTLVQMNSRSEEHVTVLDSKGDWLYGYVFPKRDTLFLVESRDGRSRCYIAPPNGEAVRVARADDCTVSLDGSTVILHDDYSDETMLSAAGIKGGKETILLDDVVGVETYQVAPDGSQVAYVVVDQGDRQLMVVERRSGEQTPVSDKLHEILAYGYAPDRTGGLFYVAREQAGDKEVQLYLSTSKRPIDQGPAIEASFTADGKYIVYLVVAEKSSTLYTVPLGEGGKRVVLSEKGIAGFAILDMAPSTLLVPVVEDNETAVYAAGLDSADVIQVLETKANLERIHYVPGESVLYVQGQAADGTHELCAVPLDGTEPLQVLAGWAELELLNRSPQGTQLVFQGRQASGAPLVLYAVPIKEGAEPVELDDGYQRYESAVFTANGRSILYTARVGDERDAVDVVLVDADGEKDPQLLYEKAYLVDVRWDQLHPFVTPFKSDR
jgi:Tol biopolymer transport system component